MKVFFYQRFSVLCLLLLLGMFWATTMGRYPVSWGQILQDIQAYCHGNGKFSSDSMVLWLRIPRICMAIIIGAALSASGMVYQCLFRNPLVSPDILGISSGACLGAAIAMISGLNHPFFVQFFAFFFGTAAVVLSYTMSYLGRGQSLIMLVMSGIVVSSFCSALLSWSKYIADPYNQLPSIVFWMMGGLHQSGWKEFFLIGPTVVIGLGALFLLRSKLNIISLGDEEAKNLGIHVSRLRLLLIVFSTVMVGATIAISGIVGWVGLVIPHISRMLVGSDHIRALPNTMVLGGIFVLGVDTIARCITSQEIPLGIVTATIGAPFFAYLLLVKQDKGWDR